MKRILAPSRGLSDWPCTIGGDAVSGDARAAQLLAQAWQSANGFPPVVQDLLSTSGIEALETAELLFAIPGWEVTLPGGGEPHVSDVMALATCEIDELPALLVVVIEARGRAIGDRECDSVAAREAGHRPSDERRLAAALDLLDLCHAPPALLDEVPFRLLEHAAATVITAREFTARHALMLVHGFAALPAAGVGVVRLAGLLAGAEQLNVAQTSDGHVLGPAHVESAATYLAWIDGRD